MEIGEGKRKGKKGNAEQRQGRIGKGRGSETFIQINEQSRVIGVSPEGGVNEDCKAVMMLIKRASQLQEEEEEIGVDDELNAGEIEGSPTCCAPLLGACRQCRRCPCSHTPEEG